MASGRVTPARWAALEVLRLVRDGEFADRALERAGAHLPERDRAWLQELAYGTLRMRGRIDHILGTLVRDGLGSLAPDVLDVLRLGTYQILEMGSVPAYAAVSQSVDLVREAGVGRATGLVNGVLQNVRRRADRIPFPDLETDPLAYLESWGSHPRWLLERWLERWGADETRRLVEANNRRPELYLRVIGIPAGEAGERLRGADIQTEPVPLFPDSLRVLPPAGHAEALGEVPAIVQDPAAALVTRYAAVPRGATVLDLCAAPGGKALGMGEAAARVAAADLSPRRLGRLRDNVRRVGLESRVFAVAADGRHPPFRPADLVLLDVPCTGTGTFRRHPDARWRIGPGDLVSLVALQRELIESAAGRVRPGGHLVYSTCSLEPEENELQIREFLRNHPDFVPDPPREIDAAVLDGEGFLSVLPQRHGTDGAFAARLRRVG